MLTNVTTGGLRCIENKPPEANGGSRAEPPTLGYFSAFFQKIRII